MFDDWLAFLRVHETLPSGPSETMPKKLFFMMRDHLLAEFNNFKILNLKKSLKPLVIDENYIFFIIII